MHASTAVVEEAQRRIWKWSAIYCMIIPVALLHFFIGSNYSGPCLAFVNGYLLDILVPFGFYFSLYPQECSLSRYWTVKAILIFGAASSAEIAQLFNAPTSGRTFDRVDFIRY